MVTLTMSLLSGYRGNVIAKEGAFYSLKVIMVYDLDRT